METKKKKKDGRPNYVFDCDSEPIPPGTKCGHMHLEEQEARRERRRWWLVGAIAAAALVVGIVIGRLI